MADTMKAIRSYWDRRAHIYAEIRQHKGWFQQIDQHVSSLIDAESCATVLDIGTGPASFAVKLAKNNKTKVVAIDISKRFLRIAKNHVKDENLTDKIFLIAASADFLPFRNACFDAATSILTIHHLPPPKMENSFAESFRVLKLKGKFALVEDWANEPRTHFQHIIYELRKILMRTEVEEYHINYLDYVRMLEKNSLKIFDVEFRPRQVDLTRFESLSSTKARRLLDKAEKIEERQQIVDITFIGAIKPAQYKA